METMEMVPPKKGKVEKTIMGIFHEVQVMGGNDYEKTAFEDILNKYKLGIYTAEQAIEKAEAIKESKQDYH